MVRPLVRGGEVVLSFKGIHRLLATAIVPFRHKRLPELSDDIQIARGDLVHLRQ